MNNREDDFWHLDRWKNEYKAFAPKEKTFLGDIRGSVYFIKDDVMDLIKIGSHKGMVAPTYEIWNRTYFRTETLYVIPSCNHYFTENLFHKYFKEKLFRGEWFNLTSEDMKWIESKDYPDIIWQSILDPNFTVPAHKRQGIINSIIKHWD